MDTEDNEETSTVVVRSETEVSVYWRKGHTDTGLEGKEYFYGQ